MKVFPCVILIHIIVLFLCSEFCSSVDILTSNTSITYGETLVSSGQTFELGFFSRGNSSKWYLGIWYKQFPEIVVWVANRGSPFGGSSGVLTINPDGDLVILNGNTTSIRSTVWSSNSSNRVPGSAAQLLETGNFVILRRKGDGDSTETYLWQSFDSPSDTLLPGQRMGWNLSSGVNRYLTSWKDENDPSPGDVTFRTDNIGIPQLVIRRGSKKLARTGLWNGVKFDGAGPLSPNQIFTPIFVYNNETVYYTYELGDSSSNINRLIITQSGMFQRLVLYKGDSTWDIFYTSRDEHCDEYGLCGANGICKPGKKAICECLYGFVPKSQREWDVQNWSKGCVRRIPTICRKEEVFFKVSSVKLPDLLVFTLTQTIGTKECEEECLKQCYCMAYAYSDIRGNGSGCIMWFGNLTDVREYASQHDLFLRMPSSEVCAIIWCNWSSAKGCKITNYEDRMRTSVAQFEMVSSNGENGIMPKKQPFCIRQLNLEIRLLIPFSSSQITLV